MNLLYDGPSTFEGYVKKLRNKQSELVTKKVSDIYIKFSYDDGRLHIKDNKFEKKWKNEIPFTSIINISYYFNKKVHCDYDYAIKFITKKKYILFIKNEEFHYKILKLLAFLVLKENIGTYDNYRKNINKKYHWQADNKMENPKIIKKNDTGVDVKNSLTMSKFIQPTVKHNRANLIAELSGIKEPVESNNKLNFSELDDNITKISNKINKEYLVQSINRKIN